MAQSIGATVVALSSLDWLGLEPLGHLANRNFRRPRLLRYCEPKALALCRRKAQEGFPLTTVRSPSRSSRRKEGVPLRRRSGRGHARSAGCSRHRGSRERLTARSDDGRFAGIGPRAAVCRESSPPAFRGTSPESLLRCSAACDVSRSCAAPCQRRWGLPMVKSRCRATGGPHVGAFPSARFGPDAARVTRLQDRQTAGTASAIARCASAPIQPAVAGCSFLWSSPVFVDIHVTRHQTNDF